VEKRRTDSAEYHNYHMEVYMYRHTLPVFALLLAMGAPQGAEIYQYRDSRGNQVFTDVPPDAEHEKISIDSANLIEWRHIDYQSKPHRNRSKRHPRRARKRARKRLSLDELRRKCSRARARYHRYRTRSGHTDWDTYKARLARYARQRKYWCGRRLRRR
jgi:hypothetical protein